MCTPWGWGHYSALLIIIIIIIVINAKMLQAKGHQLEWGEDKDKGID